MAELLSVTAQEQLIRVTVDIEPPTGYSGTVWNQGEYAWMRVNVRNTTGLPLRDVVVRLYTFGAATIAPVFIWDGDWFWAEIEPWDSKQFLVRLRATASGKVHTWASISAEVVPYVTNVHIAHRDDTIIPA